MARRGRKPKGAVGAERRQLAVMRKHNRALAEKLRHHRAATLFAADQARAAMKALNDAVRAGLR